VHVSRADKTQKYKIAYDLSPTSCHWRRAEYSIRSFMTPTAAYPNEQQDHIDV